MKNIESKLPGVVIFEPKRFGYERVFFLETCRDDILKQAGINKPFVQDNHSRSTKDILLVFGSDFTNYSNVLIILALGQLINVATGSVGQILVMSGNQDKQQYSFVIGAVISSVLAVFNIYNYGAVGAAISTSIGIVIVNSISLIFVLRFIEFK